MKSIKIFLKTKKQKTAIWLQKKYKSLPEGEKQKLDEYRKKYYKAQTNKNASLIKTSRNKKLFLFGNFGVFFRQA